LGPPPFDEIVVLSSFSPNAKISMTYITISSLFYSRYFKISDAGEAALPGGKADSLSELPYETARREAFEEIGLPRNTSNFPHSSHILHLCQLPISIAATWLGVRPCVALIEADPSLTNSTTNAVSAIEEAFAPKLNSNEVAAVFTAPLESFLDTSLSSRMASRSSIHSRPWYKGDRFPFDNGTVLMHNFYMPTVSSSVTWTGTDSESMQTAGMTFRIFGLTAKILVETARIAFGRAPQFEDHSPLGDENLIRDYIREGKMGDVMRSSSQGKRVVRAKTGDKEKQKKAKI
jgi:coenzyme A diphosphatase NUDT7